MNKESTWKLFRVVWDNLGQNGTPKKHGHLVQERQLQTGQERYLQTSFDIMRRLPPGSLSGKKVKTHKNESSRRNDNDSFEDARVKMLKKKLNKWISEHEHIYT